MASTERQSRFAKCVICDQEGELDNKLSQKEILQQRIPYTGAYVIQSICDECKAKYLNPQIVVNWS